MRYWKFKKPDGATASVQSCSNEKYTVPDAVEITKQEFDAFINSLPSPSLNPPRSGHPAQLVSVNAGAARPARVKRVWSGTEYFYDCLATETVIAEYQAGKIIIGDYLWVEFLSESEEIGGGEQIVIGKVRKTW